MGGVSYEKAVESQERLFNQGEYYSIRQEEDSLLFYGMPSDRETVLQEIERRKISVRTKKFGHLTLIVSEKEP